MCRSHVHCVILAHYSGTLAIMSTCFLLQFVMEEKLVQMVWDITIPASAPRELLDGKPLINVLSAYASNAKVSRCKIVPGSVYAILTRSRGSAQTAAWSLMLVAVGSRGCIQIAEIPKVDIVGSYVTGAFAALVLAFIFVIRIATHLLLQSGQKKVMQYMRRCFDALVDGQGGQVPLLRTLRELLKMLPDRHVSKVRSRELEVLTMLLLHRTWL